MFYETEKNNHGLPFNPFKSCVVPRPIGWITTLSQNNIVNCAPYSYFNAVADQPPMVIFSSTSKHVDDEGDKDTLKNIEDTKEFVVNIATWELREEMNLTSADVSRVINEIELAKLETLPSHLVKPPRIKKSPIHLECIHYQTIQLPVTNNKHANRMIIGRVVGIHINDEVISDGKVDIMKIKPIARLGYKEYATIDDKFVMERPEFQPPFSS